jgi:hypothetical protein
VDSGRADLGEKARQEWEVILALALSSLWIDSREAGIESFSFRFVLGGFIDTMESIVETDHVRTRARLTRFRRRGS